MKQQPTLTILTTTYNRVGLLPNLYNSLCGQNSLDFEWLVIDDGSVDDTELYIKSLNDAPFDIRYYYKNQRIVELYIGCIPFVCKYLEGGLTKSGRALRMSCPYGMMENCKSFFRRENCIRVKMKELLLYCVYALRSDLSFKEKITSSNHPIKTLIMMPFGFLLYICWRFKYSED